MSSTAAQATAPAEQFDAVIVGAGISGMYQLYRLRELGMSVRVLEAGTDIGGTWYWNRYPGARFDSESYSYGYSFSQEILDEWDWSEHFAAQPEILRYLQFVADKIDVRKDIDFRTRVTAATYDEASNSWNVTTENGRQLNAKFLITAVGPLSAPQFPNIEGMDRFKGEAYHTGLWPHKPVEFAGKRVAVIGTGATAVQVIQTIASQVDHLTVFQRTPNWCAPLGNSEISKEEMQDIKQHYPEIFAKCDESYGAFMHAMDPRSVFDLSPEEREAFFEKLYNSPGFAIWLGNCRDTLTDEKANAEITKFVAKKIRERVADPAVAEKLIPTNHGFGTRRVPMETGYYEVYNRDNVELVDIRENPIECVTGLQRRRRRARTDRDPRDRRPVVEGEVGRRPAHESRRADRRVSEYAHDRRAAERFDILQHPALHRTERRMADGFDALHARQGLRLYRNNGRCRGCVDAACIRGGDGYAVSDGGFVVHECEPEPAGEEAHVPPLRGRRTGVQEEMR
jgi:cation diffusion facilitator CzcD-associated flavoprotein CzcO